MWNCTHFRHPTDEQLQHRYISSFSNYYNLQSVHFELEKLISINFTAPGGYSQKNWVGVCGPLPKTLTLFMTKIRDFPYPIYDLTKKLIPYL